VIHGFSDEIELPERCKALVHDLVGDIGSSEGMIQFVENAKRRLPTRSLGSSWYEHSPEMNLKARFDSSAEGG
jgi:hypothetical protein